MSGVVTLGETMGLLSNAEPGPLQHAGSLRLSIGGSESNTAIGLARLGVEVTWFGRVGSDALGEMVLREIRGEGVRVLAARDTEAPTGLMLKERRSTMDTRVSYYRSGGAGVRLSAADLDLEVVRGADLLHVTGISLALSERCAGAVHTAVSAAREAGVPVSFDLNFRSKLWSRQAARQAYRSMIPLCDIVIAGDDEAGVVLGAGQAPEELARGLAELSRGEAVVKLGARGAVACSGDQIYRQPVVPVTVVDTVGAGDGFVAGYLAEYLAGEPVPARLRTAATVGAYACTVTGDWEGLPRRDELAALTATEPVSR